MKTSANVSTLVICALLISCGGTGQDSASVSEFRQEYSGTAIDGHIARATVYLDSNNNGARDPWEAFAFTDDDGYYAYNPITDTNYCAASASAEEQQFCLVTNTQLTDVVVRVNGGYDVLTGEPFLGQMSRRVYDSELGTNSVISPITSLLSDVSDTTTRNQILDVLGITDADLNTNYLDTDGAGDIDETLFNTALKIHKTVSLLANRLEDTYSEIGENYGTPSDAGAAVYRNLAQELASNTPDSLDAAIGDDSLLTRVLDNAETHLQSVYTLRELDLPADIGSPENPAGFQRSIDVVNELPALVDALIATDEEFTFADAVGAARALESVVIKAANENGVDNTIENAITFFTEASNETLVDALVTSLSEDNADVNGLAGNDFQGSDFDSEIEITGAAQLPEDAAPFAGLPGNSLRVSDLDLGSEPDNLKDSEVEFYFEGASTDDSGRFTACVKFIEDANIDGTLSDGSTRGERVEGFWSLLGGNESFSLLLTIELFGTSYSGILKPAGFEEIQGINYQRVRGDADGDFRVWHSALGLQSYDSIPADNDACEASLPSRIGI